MSRRTRSRERAIAEARLSGLLALAMFLLDNMARAWKPVEAVAWLSPFRYHSPFELLMGKALPASNIIVLTGIAVMGFALAYIFSREETYHIDGSKTIRRVNILVSALTLRRTILIIH